MEQIDSYGMYVLSASTAWEVGRIAVPIYKKMADKIPIKSLDYGTTKDVLYQCPHISALKEYFGGDEFKWNQIKDFHSFKLKQGKNLNETNKKTIEIIEV